MGELHFTLTSYQLLCIILHVYLLCFKGDTRQNIKKDLEGVMKTGRFLFDPGSTGMSAMHTSLQFETTTGSGSTPDVNGRSVLWTSEQISNFITQLGFHSRDEDAAMDQQIKMFLCVNEVWVFLLSM